MEGKGYESDKGTNKEGNDLTQTSPSHITAGYDPNRIPASIFATKPTIGWSVASNETFFSVQSDSFSMAKLGDLQEVEESFSEEPREPPTLAQPTNEVVNGTLKDQAENQPSIKKRLFLDNAQHSARISISSNDSHISINSFVFPILTGADQKVQSASFNVVFKEEKLWKPEPQSMTKEQFQKQPEPEDPEPQTSAKSFKCACCAWLQCFFCCRLCS